MKKSLFLTPLLLTSLVLVSSFRPAVPVEVNAPINPIQAAQEWTLDRGHSNVKFTVTHMVVSEVDGSFNKFDGKMESAAADFSDAKINFTVDINSINTNSENRDKHLKADDFFNAEQYPNMTFESTSMKPMGGNKYQLSGNLTIRDITKPVVFEVTHLGNTTDRGRTKAGFKAKATIDRFDYNLKWNRATEAGSLVVAKDVEININAAFVTQPAK